MGQNLLLLFLSTFPIFAGATSGGTLRFKEPIIVAASQFSEISLKRYIMWNGIVTLPLQNEFVLIDGELVTEQAQISRQGGRDGCAVRMTPGQSKTRNFTLSGDYQIQRVAYNFDAITQHGSRSILTTVILDVSPLNPQLGSLRSITMTRLDAPLREGDFSPLKLCFGERAILTMVK